MYDTRYNRDDIIPALADDGIADTLSHWIQKNASEEFLLELTMMEHSTTLLSRQLRQLLADLNGSGGLPDMDVSSLPEAIPRPSAPSGLGCSGVAGTVWVTPPGETYTLRFYVNGEYKLDLVNYNSTDPATLGATVGDIVQVCQVVDDIPGWWARIKVV